MHHPLITHRLSRRVTTAIGAVLAACALAAALLPGQAQASATGCVNSQLAPRSCIDVLGTGLFLHKIRGGVVLNALDVDTGHVRVWGPGFSHDSPTVTRSNESPFHSHKWWSPYLTVDRNLPNGARVCAAWHDDQQGHWRNAACETIHA